MIIFVNLPLGSVLKLWYRVQSERLSVKSPKQHNLNVPSLEGGAKRILLIFILIFNIYLKNKDN